MSMYTRCSSCNTHFRVTVQQLQACAGQVRCGRCTTVFDAFASLTARPPGREDEPPSLDTSVRQGRDGTATGLSARSDEYAAPAMEAFDRQSAPAALLSQPGSAADSATAATALPAGAHAYANSAQEALALMAGGADTVPMPGGLAVTAPAANESLKLPENLFAGHGGRMLPGPQWLWRAATGALGAMALIQCLFLFRAELAGSVPAMRPMLSALCRPVGCDVPLPRYPDSLYIESSDLQVMDSARPDEVLLSATLRNRADKLQAFPALELTLTDTMDRAVARRVFQPSEYLPSHLPEERGFAAGSEVSVKIMLHTSDVRAAGYRLFLFFPS